MGGTYTTCAGVAAWVGARTAHAGLVALSLACEAPAQRETVLPATLLEALPDLTPDEQARFLQGAREFAEQESAVEGLGPFFNGASCGQCHSSLGLGGPGTARILRVGCRASDGTTQDPTSGPVVHLFSTRPDLASPGMPTACDLILTERRTTSVLGAGLLEAVPDELLLAEEQRQEHGVAGRVAWVRDEATGTRRVGRFGWKAQQATLQSFAAQAYRDELGITNELFPDEIAPGGDPSRLTTIDPAPDPEAAVGAVDALAAFMRFLAPPPAPEANEPALTLFRSVGCAECHRESYSLPEAGPLGGRELVLYSDLLLHDIATGDGLQQGAAGPSELRTAPLWGLGRSPFYLHDGRALSIEQAVEMHAGQAARAKRAYEHLSAEDRRTLLGFLASL